jgi:hypothetical protein
MDPGRDFSAIQAELERLSHWVIDDYLSHKAYRAELVKPWAEDVLRSILRFLSDEQFQPFKYVVTCLILSNEPNGVCAITHSLWDTERDGSVQVQWSNESMQCIVAVYGLRY